PDEDDFRVGLEVVAKRNVGRQLVGRSLCGQSNTTWSPLKIRSARSKLPPEPRFCAWNSLPYPAGSVFTENLIRAGSRQLLKLGVEVAQSTVAKYMAKRRPRSGQTWNTFLRNLAAGLGTIDFLVVPTI